MKSRIVILSMAVVLFCVGYGFSEEGHDHGAHEHGHEEQKGSMKVNKGAMMDHSMGAVEVGNKICPVSKQKVEGMGGVVQYEYEGKIYNLCCKMCAKDFKKNPEKYIRIVEEMMAEEHEEHEDAGSEHKGSHGEHEGHH